MRLLTALLCCWSALASAQAVTAPAAQVARGSLRGTVADVGGTSIGEAKVVLTISSDSTETIKHETSTDDDGAFSFNDIPAGNFKITVSEDGLATTTVSNILHPDEALTLPQIVMKVAEADTEVEVSMTQAELAEQEVKVEEKQRLVGVLPNFYVTYNWHAQPLNPKQKFELAAHSIVDPTTFLIVGGIAGIQQYQDSFSGFDYGALGYAKRYAADFGNVFFGTLLGGWALPVVFRQDPRYFYKGTGSKRSRFFYALSTAVIAKGDNGKWQPAYASVLGDFGAGAISNLYYPASSRQGVGLTFENGLLNLVGNGIGNVFQEFLLRHMTPTSRKGPPPTP